MLSHNPICSPLKYKKKNRFQLIDGIMYCFKIVWYINFERATIQRLHSWLQEPLHLLAFGDTDLAALLPQYLHPSSIKLRQVEIN